MVRGEITDWRARKRGFWFPWNTKYLPDYRPCGGFQTSFLTGTFDGMPAHPPRSLSARVCLDLQRQQRCLPAAGVPAGVSWLLFKGVAKKGDLQPVLPLAPGRCCRAGQVAAGHCSCQGQLGVDVLQTQPSSSPALQTEMKRLSCSAGVESTICDDLAPAGIRKVTLSTKLSEPIDLKKKKTKKTTRSWRGESGGEAAKIALATGIV